MKYENKDEVLFAYRMRMFERSAKEILRLMEDQKFEDTPSLATIESWIPLFDSVPESEKLKVREFDWYRRITRYADWLPESVGSIQYASRFQLD